MSAKWHLEYRHGRSFRSSNGGDSWENWTGSIQALTKNMAIQPAADGKDLVYLFTNSGNGIPASVYFRKSDMGDWALLVDDFPAGMGINIGLPFFRDSKLRVSGSAGIWECDLQVRDYTPIINPWVLAPTSNCMLDTLQFDDHSIIDHEGVSWHWDFNPDPIFIDDADIRNPKVVLGNPGSYTVSLIVSKNGTSYTKTIEDMVTTTTCPSLEDCSNPAVIPKTNWSVQYFDSEEVNFPGYASMAIDNDLTTIWHTRWSTGSDPYPHEITIDLDTNYSIKSFVYYPRTNGSNGRIKDFEIYVDSDQDPVASGVWNNSAAPKYVHLTGMDVEGQYLTLKALSEVNDNPWASCAEIELVGCYVQPPVDIEEEVILESKAYPIPVKDVCILELGIHGTFDIDIFHENGQRIRHLENKDINNQIRLSLNDLAPGVYFILLTGKDHTTYRCKVIKQ